MVLKTFNVQEETYKKFSNLCKNHGVSMSKQVEIFMESVIEEDPEVRQEYMEKLNQIKKGRFIKVKNFAEYYGL